MAGMMINGLKSTLYFLFLSATFSSCADFEESVRNMPDESVAGYGGVII
jgi:hypothetical protein